MEDETFTQEQLNEQINNAKTEWVEKELNPIVSDRDELLQFKPVVKTDDEIAIETKQQELFQKEVSLELKSAGLEKFQEFIKVDSVEELSTQIEKFQGLLKDVKVETGYIPTDHKVADEFTKYEQDKNTMGMIGSKLAKLFN